MTGGLINDFTTYIFVSLAYRNAQRPGAVVNMTIKEFRLAKAVIDDNHDKYYRVRVEDLKTPALIAGCRALGLIDKIITGPLWRKLEESSISVLEMGSTYCELKDKLDLWSSDSFSLLDGTARCIEGIAIHSDEVWDTLIQSNSTDKMTLELLQLLCNTFSVTTQRLLIDHLPNGIYYNVTNEELIRETASVPTTNVSPERDFAVLDRFLREKPNAHLISLEAIILFAHDSTASL